MADWVMKVEGVMPFVSFVGIEATPMNSRGSRPLRSSEA
jgi:hypothetical protein